MIELFEHRPTVSLEHVQTSESVDDSDDEDDCNDEDDCDDEDEVGATLSPQMHPVDGSPPTSPSLSSSSSVPAVPALPAPSVPSAPSSGSSSQQRNKNPKKRSFQDTFQEHFEANAIYREKADKRDEIMKSIEVIKYMISEFGPSEEYRNEIHSLLKELRSV